LNLLSINGVEVNFFGFYRNLCYLMEKHWSWLLLLLVIMSFEWSNSNDFIWILVLLSSRDAKVGHISMGFMTFEWENLAK
jgi:hypothetical protein